MKKHRKLLIGLFYIIFNILIINNTIANYDFCSDTSINKYVNNTDDYKMNNDKYVNGFLEQVNNANINLIQTHLVDDTNIFFDKRGIDSFNNLINAYQADNLSILPILYVVKPLHKEIILHPQVNSLWIENNINRFGFVYSKQNNSFYIQYVGDTLSSEMSRNQYLTLEDYIIDKEINCKVIVEENEFVIEQMPSTGVNVAPGSFAGGYSWITGDLINHVKASLVVSDSFANLEKNLKNKNMPSFYEEYIAVIQMVKNDRTLSEEKRAELLKKLESPGVQFYIKDLLPAIKLVESSGNTKMNPGNNQGLFQIVNYEALFKSGDFKQLYYTPANKVKDVYQKHKILTQEDFRYQLADVAIFIHGKGIDSWIRQAENNDRALSYFNQYRKLFNAMPELKMSATDIDNLILGILRKDTPIVQDFILKNRNSLAEYSIMEPEDIYIWKEYILAGIIATHYNGWANNGTWRQTKTIQDPFINIFDNNYVSNSPTYNTCFYTIQADFSAAFTGIKRQEGVISNYIQYNYEQTASGKLMSFVVVIQNMARQNMLLAYAGECK